MTSIGEVAAVDTEKAEAVEEARLLPDSADEGRAGSAPWSTTAGRAVGVLACACVAIAGVSHVSGRAQSSSSSSSRTGSFGSLIGKSEEVANSTDEVVTQGKHSGCKALVQTLADADAEGGEEEEEYGNIKLWAQCGGDNYDGGDKCQRGLTCKSKPIEGLPSFMQCAPDPNFKCQSAEGNTDMKCYYKVTYDMTTGIHSNPERYHGLTPESTFVEFQEQNFNYFREVSECPAPCAPGSCYEVLHNEGCDSYNEFTCEQDDHSLAFDCCCKKFHPDRIASWAEVKRDNKKKTYEGPSIFCTAMMMPRTYEVDMLRAQFQRGMGIFHPACDEWVVFSNETISVNCDSDNETFDTVIINGSLEAKKGGDYNSAMNTEIFMRFWDAVLADGRVWDYDWVVKVDPDTLFFPDRLKGILNSGEGPLAEPLDAVYINNCFLGMHGPIEVFNKHALGAFKDGRQRCDTGESATHGQEDFYLRTCFEELGIQEVKAYNVLLEGENACKEKPSTAGDDAYPPCFAPEAAFHAFKNMKSMMHCWAEAITVNTTGMMAPVTYDPAPENGRHG